jgi:hypothetical protein
MCVCVCVCVCVCIYNLLNEDQQGLFTSMSELLNIQETWNG